MPNFTNGGSGGGGSAAAVLPAPSLDRVFDGSDPDADNGMPLAVLVPDGVVDAHAAAADLGPMGNANRAANEVNECLSDVFGKTSAEIRGLAETAFYAASQATRGPAHSDPKVNQLVKKMVSDLAGKTTYHVALIKALNLKLGPLDDDVSKTLKAACRAGMASIQAASVALILERTTLDDDRKLDAIAKVKSLFDALDGDDFSETPVRQRVPRGNATGTHRER